MKKKDFTKAGALYFIATLFNKGIGFITVPIFSRILSTSDYGTISTFNSWASTISVVLSLALYMAIRASFVDYNEEERPKFLSTILTFTSLLFIIFMLTITVATTIIPINANIALIYLCMIQSFGLALLDDYSYYLMMKYKYKLRTILMVLPGLISIIISIFAILFIVKENLYMGRIVPTTIVYAIVAILILVTVYSKNKPNLNRKYLKYGLKISLPLVLHSIALHILSQSDRMMITSLRDASETGIYSLVYNLSMIATVITSALDGIWIPWFTEKMKKRDFKEINFMALNYVNLITYSMATLILVSPEILKIFADSRYWEGMSIIPPIVLANYFIFIYTLYVNIEHFYKKTTYITINTIIAALVNLILNGIFIPEYGYVAAAYTTLVAYLVALILHANYAKKIEKNLYPAKMFTRSILHIIAIVIVFYLTIDLWWIRWMIMIIYLIGMFIRERYNIGKLLPSVAKNFSFFRK